MLSINLVPAEIKDKIKQAKKTADVLGIAIVIVILFAVISVLVRGANSMLLEPNLIVAKNQVVESNSQLKAFDKIKNQALIINNKVTLASQVNETRAHWSQIIQDLINCVPQNVQFKSFSASSDKSPNFVLTADTDSAQNIILFKDKLEASPFFKNVAFKSSTTSSDATDITKVKKVAFSLEFDLEKYFLAPSVKGNQ